MCMYIGIGAAPAGDGKGIERMVRKEKKCKPY